MSLLDELALSRKNRLESDFLSALFHEYLDDVLNKKLSVILYGSGSAGMELQECLAIFNVNVTAFCDRNESLHGAIINAVPVLSVDEIEAKFKDALYVISSNQYREEIQKGLSELSIKKVVYMENKEQLFAYLQLYKWHYSFDSLDVEAIEKTYNLLADTQSKNLFKLRLLLLTSYPDYSLYKRYFDEFSGCVRNIDSTMFQVSQYTPNYESYLYFNNDVIKLGDNEILIDAGAFDGDSAIEFMKACERQGGSASHIFCVEADTKNFDKLQRNTKDNSRISVINKGLWSSITTLQFASSENTFVTESRIVEDSIEMNYLHNCVEADNKIETVTIDDYFINKGVSFIKMDIEGAEVEALKGAILTLKKYRPQLAISIYHKKQDIFEIPLLIQSVCPDYRFYLRQFSEHLSETVLLATVDAI